jgi:hypothetical protein
MYNGVVTIASLIMNFLVSLTALFITSPLILPVFVILYSSTKGFIILNHVDGKKDINMQTEYPWGKCGDYSKETKVW